MKERRKRLVGTVTSAKMSKTVVVAVQRITRHPVYGKVIRETRKFKAHNEGEAARQGDVVQIVESRPMSADKRWVVEKVLQKAGE